jgi:flagellar hook-length control protein FliK
VERPVETSNADPERDRTDTSLDAPAAGTAGAAQPVIGPANASNAEVELDVAPVVKPDAPGIDDLIAASPLSAAQSVAIPAPRTDLVSTHALPVTSAAPVPPQPAAQNPGATLESLAIAENEWIDDVDVVTSELAPDRRDVRALDGSADRTAPSRSTTDASLTEPARETTVAPRAHDTDRAAEILKQIRLRFSPELRQATIHLAPPELGRVSIHLTLEDRRLTAAVRSERPETLEVLGRHLPELRAALASHGIEAEQFELALGFQNDPHAQADQRDREHATFAHSISRAETRSTLDAPLTRALATASGVDLYA